MTQTIEQLQARVAELESLSVTKILVDIVPGEDGNGHEVFAKSIEDVERKLGHLGEKAEDFYLETVPLRKKVAKLEAENARLKAESRDACFGLNDYYGSKLAAAQAECEFQRNAHKQAEELMLEQSKQLAAEQLNNKRLRDVLNQWIGIAANCSIESGCCGCGESIENHSHPMICGHSPVDMADSVVREAIDSTDKALSTQASTEALDKYVAEKVKDVQLQDIEQYLLQMAGISTAAIGYWKEDDSIHPDYDTPAIRDVAKLYANYESRTKQRDLAVEALEKVASWQVVVGKVREQLAAAQEEIAAINRDKKALTNRVFDLGCQLETVKSQVSDACAACVADQDDVPLGVVGVLRQGLWREYMPETTLDEAEEQLAKSDQRIAAEQIANETAEACAKACEDVIGNTPHDQRMLAAIDCAVMLRSGAWKDFKK